MSFMANIQIQKKLPAVQYEPDLTQEPAGLWHEDHEINGVMYRASNASFDETRSLWFQKGYDILGKTASLRYGWLAVTGIVN